MTFTDTLILGSMGVMFAFPVAGVFEYLYVKATRRDPSVQEDFGKFVLFWFAFTILITTALFMLY